MVWGNIVKLLCGYVGFFDVGYYEFKMRLIRLILFFLVDCKFFRGWEKENEELVRIKIRDFSDMVGGERRICELRENVECDYGDGIGI